MRYLALILASVALVACTIPPPPSPIHPSEMDNTELCTNFLENEKNLEGWIAYGSFWAAIFNINLEEKINELRSRSSLYQRYVEARNILCVTAESVE